MGVKNYSGIHYPDYLMKFSGRLWNDLHMLTKKAMKIAYEAHKNQYDISGVPYIFHPMIVASSMQDEITTCVALLHDVAEDTEISLEQLAEEFPESIMEPLKAFNSIKKVQTILNILREIKTNKNALKVKLSDIKHNMDESRIVGGDVPKEKLDWWRFKYKRALEILLDKE